MTRVAKGSAIVWGLMGVALVLAGCGGGQVSQDQVTTTGDSVASSSSSTESSANTSSSSGSLPPGVPATYYEDMAAVARDFGITDPPDVAPVRAISLSESAQVTADCLTGQGFPSRVEDGSTVLEFDTAQREAARLAQYVCLSRYPTHETYTRPLSETQQRVFYDWMVEETLPCMQDLGYPAPEPPSFETFSADYERGELWFPDTELTSLADDMNVIMDACQVLPPDDVLYGSDR